MEIELEIERDPGVVRIIVRDGGFHMDPDEATFHIRSDGHLGLFVVDTLGRPMGFLDRGDKGVWFEMQAPGRARRDAAGDQRDRR